MLRRGLLACGAVSWLVLAGSPTVSHAAQPSVQEIQEAALPPGVLPAWQTQAERGRPRVRPPTAPIPSPPPSPPAPGYRVPAEFEPVAAFLVSRGDWTDGSWTNDIQMLVDMINAGTVASGAGAIVLTDTSVSSYESYLAGLGADMTRVHVVRANAGLDAKWARDFGPISVYDPNLPGRLGFADLHYYDSRASDDAVVAQLASALGVPRYGLEGNDHSPPDPVKLYMEGGNFMTDGQGTCILSNDIASDNAAEGNTQADTLPEVETILRTYLNCQKIIWLTPLPHNSTGHVDMYAKLLTPTDILMIDFPNQSGANGQADAIIEANVEVMQAATNLSGQPFNIHRVVIPSVSSSTWIYRTYTNSTILNHVVLVPTYQSAADDAALQAYRDILGPDYTVTGVDASAIVAMGGAVHCTTMQIASACGDGKAQTMLFESCDGTDLAGQTCLSLGLGDGQLGCTADCEFDTTGCGSGPEPQPEAGVDAEAEAGDAGAEAELDATPGPDAVVEDHAGQDAVNPADARGDEQAAPGDGGEAEASIADGGAPDGSALPSATAADDDGGCSCEAAGASRGGVGMVGFAALLLVACGRRRRAKGGG
jgi:agmatine/peptidylarginine deiminase